ncbi:uncharacterized protein PG986_003046 [Apiospora aurea]|uniref:Uncharacterized protein n=1 Tax=Apiospora aurea TaxID=335848 RepID=A0ABR1QQK6_9PEZI
MMTKSEICQVSSSTLGETTHWLEVDVRAQLPKGAGGWWWWGRLVGVVAGRAGWGHQMTVRFRQCGAQGFQGHAAGFELAKPENESVSIQQQKVHLVSVIQGQCTPNANNDAQREERERPPPVSH